MRSSIRDARILHGKDGTNYDIEKKFPCADGAVGVVFTDRQGSRRIVDSETLADYGCYGNDGIPEERD